MTLPDHERLHAEHERWQDEHAAWQNDLRLWNQAQSAALAMLDELRRALTEHGHRLAAHGESIRSHDKLIDGHERVMHEIDEHPTGHQHHGVLDHVMEMRHDSEQGSHNAQRDVHALLAERHAHLIQPLLALKDRL